MLKKISSYKIVLLLWLKEKAILIQLQETFYLHRVWNLDFEHCLRVGEYKK